ncbi:cytosolic beta-glucosidase-like [Branchiostoma floridae]|uniref:Cytosolic beta-glucosidase-like n=2 Tax=Branchiostoma floridae TaxID=7739 RepID=A0A9J7MR13_BRAFL|nr:cytosolic beta-glucosidase-like [Branchiostoma floridae]
MKWLVLLALLFWTAGLCSASAPCWLQGADESACAGMMLTRGATAGPQSTLSPYRVAADYDKAHHRFNVHVAGDEFRSVLLQARRPGSTEPVGTFLPPSERSGLKRITCSSQGDSITNRRPLFTNEIRLTWEIPEGESKLGEIYFVATVVRRCNSYWVNVQSQSVAELTRDIFWPGTVPEGYLWSTATASYQIEGAWNHAGKGESMWDHYAHSVGSYEGDEATKSYEYYSRDVEEIDGLGLNSYRFSISWTRILPDGTVAGGINQDGIDYYNNLINELLINGMTPYVTLYHWDGPQALDAKYGSWLSDSIVKDFNDYARVCYQAFGDRVKHWVTFNEPWSFVMGGFGIAGAPPGIWDSERTEMYKAAHNVIRAHARAWHTYDEEFRAEQQGSVGIVLGSLWSEPKDPNNPQDVLGAHLYQQFVLGWYANPIFGNGNYPQEMIDMIAASSQQEGRSESRLPVFTEEEILFNRGTADFVGLNQYSARLIFATDQPTEVDETGWFNWMSIMVPDLKGYQETVDPSWPKGEMIFLRVVPWCVRRQLDYFKRTYQYEGAYYLTETGISEATFDPPKLDDVWRQCYYMLYTNEVVKAIELDGVDHRGFFAWTLMDNVEWASGIHEHFGLYYTDFTDPARTRTPKGSVATYREITTNNGFPHGAAHTMTAQDLWDWCHTQEPYTEAVSQEAAHRTTADPTVDDFLPGVRVGAAFRDKVVKNNNNNNNNV